MTKQQQPKRRMKAAGPLGIRGTVWFFSFGLLLCCVCGVIRYHTKEPIAQVGANRNSLVNTQPPKRATFHRVAQTNTRPEETAYERGEIDVAAIDTVIEDRRRWSDWGDLP